MTKIKFTLILILICGAPGSYGSGEVPNQGVYEVDRLTDGLIIGVTGLASLLATLKAGQWIKQKCPCDSNAVNSFDRGTVHNSSRTWGLVSDWTLAAVVLAPPILDALDLGNTERLREDLTVYAETFTVNQFLTSIAKYSFSRPRPIAYAGDPSVINRPEAYLSFFSGHTSTAFSSLSTAAVTLNQRYHAGIWPWLVVAGVGSSVALERVAAGKHFPTDVIVGAVAGTAVGILVPYFHLYPGASRFWFTAAPVDDGGVVFAELKL